MIIIMKYVKYVLMSFIYALLFNLTEYLGAGIALKCSPFVRQCGIIEIYQ